MTTPPPPPERPLVEAWSIRTRDGVRVGSGLSDDYAWAQRELQVHAGGRGAVVPLIAADRLTDEALVEEVARNILLTQKPDDMEDDVYLVAIEAPSVWPRARAQAADYLAALRTHLERP